MAIAFHDIVQPKRARLKTPYGLRAPTSFESERLVLRDMTRHDATGLAAIFSHPDFFYAHTMQDGISAAQGARDYAELAERTRHMMPRDRYTMAILSKDDHRLIGAVVLLGLRDDPDGGREAEIGYFIDAACQGQGYATEAAMALRDFARDHLLVSRLCATVDPENVASCRILEKMGLRCYAYEAVSAYRKRDGALASRLHYRGML